MPDLLGTGGFQNVAEVTSRTENYASPQFSLEALLWLMLVVGAFLGGTRTLFVVFLPYIFLPSCGRGPWSAPMVKMGSPGLPEKMLAAQC